MGILKSDKLQEANRTLLAAYETFATTIESRVEALCSVETVPTEAYSFPFFSGLPDARPWLGERQFKDGEIKEINGKCIPWERSVAARVPDVNSGIIGKYVSRMSALGDLTARFKDSFVAALLNNGTSTSLTLEGYTKSIANYDGLACFSASHLLDDGSAHLSNLLTGSALSYANLLVAIGRMHQAKNQLGQNLGVKPKYLVVPGGALEMTARGLLNNDLINDGSNVQVTNTVKGMLELIVLPGLTSATSWFIIGEKDGMKPFGYIEYEAPSITVTDSPDSYSVYYKNEVHYGWQANADAVMGPWQFFLKAEQ